MCRALVHTLADHTQGLIWTWPKCLSACSQPLGECTEHEVPVQEGQGQLGSYKQMLGRLCNMAADACFAARGAELPSVPEAAGACRHLAKKAIGFSLLLQKSPSFWKHWMLLQVGMQSRWGE